MTVATEAFRLAPFLDAERHNVEAALQRALGRLPRSSLSEEWRAAIFHGVMAGGKRIRPILCATCFKAVYRRSMDPGLEGAVYDLAASLELIHAYSLMHDDLPCMDDADLRRGARTPHTVYGETLTMRAAVLLIPLAGLHAWIAAASVGVSSERARFILQTLTRAAGQDGMVGGQALDLLAEGRRISLGQLRELHGKKTGALLTASAQLGAVAAGAVREVEEAFAGYGRAIGLAFQIADDVLDATADVVALGKNPSDRDREKSTYVSVVGVKEARREAETIVGGALAELRGVGIVSEPLEMLAWHVVHRMQ